MNQDQTDRIAREYAEYRLPNPLTYDDYSMYAYYKYGAKEILEWLLRDHLIVEKSRVMDEYDTAVSTQHSDNCDTARYSQTIRYHLEDLFGEETFNKEEQ